VVAERLGDVIGEWRPQPGRFVFRLAPQFGELR